MHRRDASEDVSSSDPDDNYRESWHRTGPAATRPGEEGHPSVQREGLPTERPHNEADIDSIAPGILSNNLQAAGHEAGAPAFPARDDQPTPAEERAPGEQDALTANQPERMMSGAIPLKDIATGLLYELDPEYERLVRSAPEQKVVREVTSGKWYSWAEFAVLVPELTEMLGEGLEDVKGLDEAKAGEGREGMATATEAALQEQALGKKKKKGWGIRKLFGKKEAGTAKAASGPQPAAAAPGQARGPGAAGTLTDAAAGGGGEQSPQSNSTRETPMSWRDGQPGHSRPASSSGAAELPSGVRAYSHQRVMSELTDLRVLQTLPAHDGHIWCMAFNQEGSRLASAGQDRVIRLWRVLPRAAPADSGFRPATFAAEQASRGEGAAPEADEENHGMRRQPNAAGPGRTGSGIADGAPELGSSSGGGGGADAALLEPAPAGVLAGHDDIIMDLEWSASTFLLSASMDKTVRLWHVSSSQQLRVYRHTDIVTSVSMHPIASTFFASASVDATIRIWSITDMKVVDYDKLDSDDMLSCCQFSRTGNRLLVGTTKGRCRFYTVHLSPQPNLGLKYLSQFGEADGAEEQVLITTGDNRLRLYHNTVQVCKYKGHRNQQTMIAASFSPDGQYIICGSDDGQVFLWAADSDLAGVPLGSGGGYKRREKTQSYECFKAFDSVCTVAVFAPPSSWQRRATEAPAVPITKAAAALIRSGTTSSTMSVGSRATDEELQRAMTRAQAHLRQARLQGAVIVTASVNGEIRVFENVGGPSWI